MPDQPTALQNLYGELDCRECGRPFLASSANAKYCTLKCQNIAYRKRRKLREALGERGVPHVDRPLTTPRPNDDLMARVRRESDEALARIKAKEQGREVTYQEAPSEQQSVLAELGYATKPPELTCPECHNPASKCTCPPVGFDGSN